MALKPVIIKAKFDLADLNRQLNDLSKKIEDSIKRGFAQGSRAATTGANSLSVALKKVAKAAGQTAESSQKAARAVQQLTTSEQRLNNQLKSFVGTLSQVAQIQQRFNQLRAKSFADALTAASAEQKFTQELLRQAAAAGADIQSLQRLATATGAFSQADIRAASAVAKLRAEFDLLNTAFQKGSATSAQLASKIKELARAEAVLDISAKKAAKSLREETKAALGTKSAFGSLQIGIAKFNNIFFGLQNALSLARTLFQGLFDTLKEGAVVAQTTESFNKFASEVIGMPDLLQQLDDAARGTISTFDLMKDSLLLVSGLTPDLARTFSEALVGAGGFETSLLDVARAAQILNPALGDIDFFLRSLSIGIKRNERRWIDNLGIVISAREAYQRYGQELGISVLQLSATDKTMAVLNETLRVGKLLVDQVGDSVESAVDPFSRMEARVADLSNRIKLMVFEAINPFIEAWDRILAIDYESAGARQADAATKGKAAVEDQIDALRGLAEAAEATKDIDLNLPFSLQLVNIGIPGTKGIIGGKFQRIAEEAAMEQQRAVLQELLALSEDAESFVENFNAVFGELEDPTAVLQDALEGFEFSDEAIRRLDQALATGVPFTEALAQEFALLNKEQLGVAVGADSATRGIDSWVTAAVKAKQEAKASAEAIRLLRVEISNIADDALPKQIELTEELANATTELDKAIAKQKLAESFDEMGVALFEALGVSDEAATQFQVTLGLLGEEAVELTKETLELNFEIENLFSILADGEKDPIIAADAFSILKLGLAETAEEALELARNEEFVANELASARKEAAENADELERLAEVTEATTEATKKLRAELSGIIEDGFGRASGAIADYAAAMEGAAAASGEFKTVTVDNSARIAAITEELFGDLDKDTREALDDRLDEIRDAGQDVSQEYADILHEIGSDLSQAERDSLIVQLFDLQAQQGSIVSGIFGADPQAKEQFGEDAKAAIQELIDIRRQTVIDLFKVEGREIPFGAEVQLLLDFELIDDLEAELLLKERQFFSIIDALFGEASIIDIEIDGEIKTIDIGAITLSELGPEVDTIIRQIEAAVGAGLGDEVLEIVQLTIGLVAAGVVDVADVENIVRGALEAIQEGFTVEQAIAIGIDPQFRVVIQEDRLPAVAEEAISQIQAGLDERFGEGVEVAVPIQIEPVVGGAARLEADQIESELQSRLEADVEVEIEVPVGLTEFEQLLADIELVREVADELADEEFEVQILADTDEAQEAIDSFIAANADLEVVVDIVGNVQEETFPDTAPAPGQPPAPGGGEQEGGGFQQGGFTGRGPRGNTAGTVEFEEFVFSARDVDNLGVGALGALQNGAAAIVPSSFLDVPQSALNVMIAALSPQAPTLAPAQTFNNTVDNSRSTVIDRSVSNVNNFFDSPPDDVVPQRDFFG